MFSNLEQTFRWYGPPNPVTPGAIRQTGSAGVVTALHQVPVGEVWSPEAIRERLEMVEGSGLRWSVVESVNVHEAIRRGEADRDDYIEKYIQTLKNLSEAGISIVCYNFMPVLDWTRTNIDYLLPNGASALRFDATSWAAFDLYILEREAAYSEFTPEQQRHAKEYLDSLTVDEKATLTHTMMAGLPGTTDVLTVEEFKAHLEKYADIDAIALKNNLAYFLKAV